MFPRGMIAAGVFLLLLAATGLIYALARKKPPLESPEPIQLQLQQETPAVDEALLRTPPLVTKSREHVVVRRIQEPPAIKTFAVKILSPAMAQTFTAPAKVTLTASANREAELTGIEYYKSPDEETVCQSLTTPAPFPANRKIGEAHTKPYEVVWNIPQADTFTVVAVATYESGEKQISAPVVIVVDPAESYDGPQWRGWRPAYPNDQQPQQDTSLMAAPTPTPNPESCPKVVVNKLSGSPRSDTLSFQAVVTGAEVPPDLTFNWNLSAGEIVSGEGTSTISVAVDRILDPELVASVEIGRLPAVCATVGSTSVRFEQPRWVTKEFRNKLEQMRSDVARTSSSIIRRYIQLYGESNDCVDQELLNEATLLKKYFVESRGVADKDVVIVNAGHSEEQEGLNLFLFYNDDKVSDELQESLKRPLVPCRSSSSSSVSASNAGTPINRACPDLNETIEYFTSLHLGNFRINTCPYNPRDPLNSGAQFGLFSDAAGVYSNYPSFKYWANAGKLLSNRPNGIWDLSAVKLRPRRYVAIAMADDGCGCTNINTEPIAVTNFCSPCLTMSRTCLLEAGDQSLQSYHATVGEFAVAGKTTLNWTTTKGKIIRGQGTPDIVIDTSGLSPGEEYVVTVTAGGLLPYCVNTVGQHAVVQDFPCPPPPYELAGGAPRVEGRTARRRPQPEEEITQSTIENEPTTSSPAEGPVNHGPPRTNEKEFMKLSWTPHVKTDDAVTIKVVYNRTTDSFQVSNSSGEISEELKLGKQLKEYFGADYQTFGDIHLQAPGLKRDSSQEQFQSFDDDKVEWEWLLRPEGSGTYYFDVELWIKGEPRDNAANKPSQPLKKIWSETKNRIDVIPPFMTRPKVYAGVGMCAVLGLGLCVRGLKTHLHIGDTYNVAQAGVVGHNVTLTNTTVNQQATNNNLQDEEKHDG